MIKGHGDDHYKYADIKANFSSNVYSDTNNEALLQHLQEQLPRLASAYPEPEPYRLQAMLAEVHRVKPSQVLVTNGATEAIYLIAQLTAGKRTHIIQPTFSEYADACALHGHQFVAFDEGNIETLWFCNPNNPTGLVRDEDELMQRVGSKPLCIVDRSYDYFTREELRPIAQHLHFSENRLFIHSLTKRYRITGLRIGYVIGSEKLITGLKKLRYPWSVNALAIEAGEWIVQNEFPRTIERKELFAECKRLQSALAEIKGVEVFPTDTHFFLIKTAMKASDLKEKLAQDYGLLVRDASNFEGLSERYIRIATQTAKENALLIEALRQVILG